MTTLTDLIHDTWQQLKDAAKDEDWAATRQAFDKMEKLQRVNEESTKSLRDHFPDLSQERASTKAPPPALSTLHRFSTGKRATTRPKELRIGTERIPISLNNQIVIAAANWILQQGKSLPEMRNFIHRDNSGFPASAQTKRLEDGSFIEIGDSQATLMLKARKLLNVCGFQARSLEVLLEDGTTKKA